VDAILSKCKWFY